MIGLATFVKDEAHCIEHMLHSIKDYVDEIVVVDTGSTDATKQICRSYGARVYEVGFTDFGKIRTLAAHLCREPWVLMLDADETLEGAEDLKGIIDYYHDQQALALPRKRWADLGKVKQIELEAYPDWQVRLFKNSTEYVWKRELHEYFHGAAVHHLDGSNSPPLVINHFHDSFKHEAKKRERLELYTRLAKEAGVTVEGGREIKV